MATECCTKLEVAQKRCSIVFLGHMLNFKVPWDKKNHQLWPKLDFSGLLLQFEFTNGYEMMHKAWSNLGEVPFVFRHLLNFKVTLLKISLLFTQSGHFQTVTTIRIHSWLWNDAQSLKKQCPIVFQGHIHQISRSHGTENCWFWPKLSVFGQ